VIVDVQRTGPSTGMPTRTQQGDILECAYASHGDTKHILLFPGNPKECFDDMVRAFDVAERFQTPVFLMSDLDIGMNDWVVPPMQWDDSYQPDRGRVLTAEQLEKMDRFYRYYDWDQDFVAARTLPGTNERGSFFTRGSGHNQFGAYTEYPDEYQEVVDRIKLKHSAAGKHVPKPVILPSSSFKDRGDEMSTEVLADLTAGESSPTLTLMSPARYGVVTVGGCELAVREALTILAEQGIECDFMRIRAFPFDESVERFLVAHDFNFVVEQNRDAQLRSLLTLETAVYKRRMRSVLVYGGFPLSAQHVVDGINEQLADPEHTELEGRPHTIDHQSDGDESDMGSNT
jgi:2-oxoglutarate ferredoxin oxidoreductase subunit alpha